jgi:hypothetical protein
MSKYTEHLYPPGLMPDFIVPRTTKQTMAWVQVSTACSQANKKEQNLTFLLFFVPLRKSRQNGLKV